MKTGSMVNQGAWSKTVAGGTTIVVPAGYHNGSGLISATLGTLHRKDYLAADTYENISLNVVSTFGIPQYIAQTLSADNFNIRIEKFSWYNGWGRDVVAKYTVSYDPSSCILTGTFVLNNADRTSYYQSITYVSAFWIE